MSKYTLRNVTIEAMLALLFLKQTRKSIYFFRAKIKESAFKMPNLSPKKLKMSFRQFSTLESYFNNKMILRLHQ